MLYLARNELGAGQSGVRAGVGAVYLVIAYGKIGGGMVQYSRKRRALGFEILRVSIV